MSICMTLGSLWGYLFESLFDNFAVKGANLEVNRRVQKVFVKRVPKTSYK